MRVGIVGLGFRMGYLGHVFSSVDPDFRIAGYVDPAPAGLATLREKGVPEGRPYPGIPSLLAAETPDLLMIGSPNHLHLGQIREGLEAGVKVFSEKPVVISEDESVELARLLARHGQDRLLVGLVMRYAPLYRDLRAAQAGGRLGDIVSIEASEHIAPWHGAFFMRDWRRRTEWTGGFMLEKCCHDIDVWSSVIGARPARVASFGGRATFVPANRPAEEPEHLRRKPSGWMADARVYNGDGDIVDHQVAIVEYENGAKLAFHTNLNVPDAFRRFAVIGTKGMAEGDFVRRYLTLTDARAETPPERLTYADTALSVHYGADEEMAAEVIAHVMRGGPLPVSPVDALEAGLLAIAMDRARASGTVVDMAPVWDRFDRALAG